MYLSTQFVIPAHRGEWAHIGVGGRHTCAMLGDLAAVTRDQLEALELEIPDQLAHVEIPLWQSSSKSKYHWAGKASVCKHLPGQRYWGPRANREPPPVSHRVPALDFNISSYDVCMDCLSRATISPPADAFVAVVAELARAEEWLQEGLAGAADGDWTWLQFARWKSRQRLLDSSTTDHLHQIRGTGWKPTAMALAAAIDAHRRSAECVTQRVAEGIGDNPGRSALLERAIRMVETDSPALEESRAILQISGCAKRPDGYLRMMGVPGTGYEQPSPWHVTAGTWRDAKKRGGSISADLLADHFDEQFPHVHDVSALPCCPTHDPPLVEGDCVHTWALRSAQAHRRAQVADWVERLELAAGGLISTDGDTSADCTHLLCVPGWPLIRDGMDSIAYLAQFHVVSGPHRLKGYDGYGGYDSTSVAVLKVPSWAAAHTAELRAPMHSEPITGDVLQAVRVARQAGVPIVRGEFGSRRKPSSQVAEARLSMAEPTGYYHQRTPRPLAPGASPVDVYGNDIADPEWTAYAVRRSLAPGASFVYGIDDLALLSMGLADGDNWRVGGRVQIELQTASRWHDKEGPVICEIDGVVESVHKNGALTFTPEGLRDSVTIPAAYVVGLTFTR